ncbi:MAG TPA: PAS domain S-box protein, partial [Rhodopila sp.]|nr:PAS domain S-box protein [Rhodopila sp.]
RVIYDLMTWMPPGTIEDLILRQYLPPRTVLTVIDAAGMVVARVPNPSNFVGKPIVASLWGVIRTHDEGVTHSVTLEGAPSLAAFTHVGTSGWSVIVGAPEGVVLSDLHGAMAHIAAGGAVVLVAALLFGSLAARGITRPIERLQLLAVHDDQIDPAQPIATGLAEVDLAARALVGAAAERRKVAADLAESEQRFRALFEQAGSGMILIDPDTLTVLDCNESAAAFLGYGAEEFKGRPITDFSPHMTAGQVQDMVQAVLAGRRWRYETQAVGRSGTRDLLNAVAPVQVSGRTLMLVNQIDVTDLRRAEAGLRANKERLELAREGAKLGIWDWDAARATLTWSEHEWFLHGLTPRPEGPTVALFRQAVDPADLPHVLSTLRATLEQPGRLYAVEYSVPLPDGTARRLLARGQAVRDEDGRVLRMVGISMDVTARYEAEMARDRLIRMLETERSRLSEIIEALPAGVGIVKATGTFVLANARMRALEGSVISSMAADPQAEWIALDANGRRLPREQFPIRRALTHGETCLPGRDFLRREKDGRETWIRVGALPLRREKGVVVEALGILQDIDAEKRLLEFQQQITAKLEQRVREEMAAREAAQQRAAHAERMHALGQIAGGIAHDFNNVLQAVSGGAALIERRPNDAERVLRNARMVLDASRRGAAITSRLLAFARRGDLRAENIEAAALLADMAEVLTHTLGGSVVCRTVVAPDLPPLFADRGQLETVLVNLATNARDAMAAGGTLTLSAEAEAVAAGVPHPAGLASGNYVRITVADTGTGMDQSVLARVTEPFFTTKEPGKGTGLGLAMAKGFVEQSGGSLSIDSAPGRGTRVILWLPSATGPATTRGDGGTSRGVADDRPWVLLVDDDPIVRDVLRLSLEDAGYAVLAAESGPAALACLGIGDKVDLIVSDLTMPGMDGITLIKAAQERRPRLPAVLLTGYAGDGAALAVGGAISGTFSLLRKPVSGTQLVDRISALLAARRTVGTG